jgi:hypothetical protein
MGLMPLGSLMEKGIKQILGAAHAGLRIYPVIVVDLKEITDMTDDALHWLEEGLQRLVEEKRLWLGLEPQKWTLQTPRRHPAGVRTIVAGAPASHLAT